MAQQPGIGFVHEKVSRCPDVSVAENVFMAKTNASRAWLMDDRALGQRHGRFPSNSAISTRRNLTDENRIRDVAFTQERGEIPGIANLIAAGRSEIVRGICRLEGDVSVEIWLQGDRFALRDDPDSIARGMVDLTEDRKGGGVFPDLLIAANVSARGRGRAGRNARAQAETEMRCPFRSGVFPVRGQSAEGGPGKANFSGASLWSSTSGCAARPCSGRCSKPAASRRPRSGPGSARRRSFSRSPCFALP